MKKLVEADNRQDAEKIRWYLESKGVETWLDEEDRGDLTVWLISEEQADQARALIAAALSEEKHHEIKNFIQKKKKQLSIEQKQVEKSRKFNVSMQNQSGFWQSPVTYSLITICVTIFLFNGFLDKQGTIYRTLSFSENPYSRYWIFKNFDEIRNGQFWRFFTPAFLHFGWFHIIFNTLWCIQIGRLCESLMTTRRHIAMLLSIALISHTMFYLVSGPNFGGLSGVIYGYIGYLWAVERFGNVRTGLEDRTPQFFFIWFIICLALSLTGLMHIANTIHGIGALVGILFAIAATGTGSQLIKKIRFNKNFAKETATGLLLLIAAFLVDHFT